MGRWMKIVDDNGNIHIESPPYFLLYTTRVFPKNLISNFPILARLDISSESYIDEIQEVHSNDLLLLKKELLTIKGLINYECFFDGLDNSKFKEHLIGEIETVNNESRACLDQMINQVSEAIDNKLKIVVML